MFGYWWGFSPYATITWNKGNGPVPFGPYQITSEFLVFGYRGVMSRVVPYFMGGRLKTVCNYKKTRKHSQKPADFYKDISQFRGTKIDVFARTIHPGFDAFGDQLEEINDVNK